MDTLLTPRVWGDITTAAVECQQPARVAVAYFGEKGDSLLPLSPGSSIVVDASLPTVAVGSTCPAALERLRKRGTDIYSAQYLHAKVYAFNSVAFVGSANASTRSKETLIEAIQRTTRKSAIVAARKFVESICITRLSAKDLYELAKYYRPPKVIKPNAKQAKFSTLLMELTYEQGAGRETQVQPPKSVWEHYFGVAVGKQTLPTLTLVNSTVTPNSVTIRRVVKHHHNYTLELVGTELPRPAILEMRRTGPNRYVYYVHRPGHGAYSARDKLLDTIDNPLWASGRRWGIV